jgi:hypothetical protein
LAKVQLLAAAIGGLVCLAATPVAARADGDPASDYLLGQSAFVPPDAKISPGAATQLRAVLADAKAKRYEVRVAVIASRFDLGSVGVLWRQPKRYARFLGQELYFVYKGRLVVVMPDGFGVSFGGRARPREQAILDRLAPPGQVGDGLALGAIDAVRVLARARGVSVPRPQAVKTATGNSNRDRILIAIAAAVAVLLAAGSFVFVRRRRSTL